MYIKDYGIQGFPIFFKICTKDKSRFLPACCNYCESVQIIGLSCGSLNNILLGTITSPFPKTLLMIFLFRFGGICALEGKDSI